MRIIGKRECGFVSKRRVGRKGAHRTYYLARSSIEWTETKGATEQNNVDVQGNQELTEKRDLGTIVYGHVDIYRWRNARVGKRVRSCE